MNNRYAKLLSALLGIAVMILAGCERRPLTEELAESVLIPVKIDWSNSGIPVADPSGSGYVHRVSLRFFPKDGGKPFDRYLESNVMEGEIEVPVGEYSVVVFNESVYDAWWEDAIIFSNIDSYDDFAATIVADDAANWPHYTLLAGENLIVEPFMLSSWSIGDFKVTEQMLKQTHAGVTRTDDDSQALTKIVMRQLTFNVTVTAWVENLVSAQLIQGAARGFANTVMMASGKTGHTTGTHVFKLNNRRWDDSQQKNGTVSKEFLSFGRLTDASKYWLNMDVLFTTGALYDQPQLFDVTDQVLENPNINININIDVDVRLPYIEGGIHVGDWDDEDITIQ